MAAPLAGDTQSVARRVSGPRANRILGWRWNAFQFRRDPIGFMKQLYQEHGTFSSFVEFDEYKRGTVCIFSAEHLQPVLSNTSLFHTQQISLDADKDTPLGHLGNGLPVMNGEKHKQQRRLIMPAFHKRNIETYRDDMVDVTNHMLDSWHPGEVRNIAHEMDVLAIQIVVKSLFGFDDLGNTEQLGEMFNTWLRLNISSALLPLNFPALPYGRLLKHSEQLENRILELVRQKRQSATSSTDVLSMLIAAHDEDGSTMSDREIIGQINLLFAAGYDTTSNALTWTLFLLSQHPAIMADLLDELDGVLHGEAPRVDQLPALQLLDRVINESLRLLPPATFNVRRATEDCELGGYHLAEKSAMLLGFYITHRLPEIYADPDRFLPDRWLTINPSPYQYVPFGAGPRMCIGAQFAWMEMKLVLATLLQRYRLSMAPNTRVDRKEVITLCPKYGLPMHIHLQDRQFDKVPVKGNIHEMVVL